MFETESFIDIQAALVVDLATLAICTILLLRYGRLAHSHPAITYLFFHLLVVSFRLMAILAGAPTLFGRWLGIFTPVTNAEIVRASLLADLALAVMTIAWITASVIDKKKNLNQSDQEQARPVTLSLRHIWTVVVFAFPIGVVGVALLGHVPGIERPEIDLGEWQESSWISITMMWAGLALLALIYWYGFRWWLVAPMAFHLFIMALQGYHRFRVIIPLILILQIYLDRRRRKWPPAIIMLAIIAGILVFFPMKTIGKMAQEGASITEIREYSSEILRDAMAGQAADQHILDQLASSLTLIDMKGNFYYGSAYLALLTTPIPRQWWPEKPGLASHIHDFSIPSRPMGEMGMVMTHIGEFYLNFWYPGIVIMSFLTAYFLARIYFRAYRNNYYSIARFIYLLIACNLIQVYRDGLMSLFIFTLINMMPLAGIAMLHFVMPMRQRRMRMQLPSVPLVQK